MSEGASAPPLTLFVIATVQARRERIQRRCRLHERHMQHVAEFTTSLPGTQAFAFSHRAGGLPRRVAPLGE